MNGSKVESFWNFNCFWMVLGFFEILKFWNFGWKKKTIHENLKFLEFSFKCFFMELFFVINPDYKETRSHRLNNEVSQKKMCVGCWSRARTQKENCGCVSIYFKASEITGMKRDKVKNLYIVLIERDSAQGRRHL